MAETTPITRTPDAREAARIQRRSQALRHGDKILGIDQHYTETGRLLRAVIDVEREHAKSQNVLSGTECEALAAQVHELHVQVASQNEENENLRAQIIDLERDKCDVAGLKNTIETQGKVIERNDRTLTAAHARTEHLEAVIRAAKKRAPGAIKDAFQTVNATRSR